jgi:hypothetical protein
MNPDLPPGVFQHPYSWSSLGVDVRGSFATRLMTKAVLNDEEIASIMGWSPDEVKRIRMIYVDDGARSVAIGRRIAGKL